MSQNDKNFDVGHIKLIRMFQKEENSQIKSQLKSIIIKKITKIIIIKKSDFISCDELKTIFDFAIEYKKIIEEICIEGYNEKKKNDKGKGKGEAIGIIGFEHMKIISNYISSSQGGMGIRVIKIGGNQIGNEGLKILLDGILQYDNVYHLDVSDNLIKDEKKMVGYRSSGCFEMKNFLQKTKTLSILNMNRNEIGSKGVFLLMEGMKKNRSVVKLFLKDCSMEEKGVEKILETLKNPLPYSCLSIVDIRQKDPAVMISKDNIKKLKEKNRALLKFKYDYNDTISKFKKNYDLIRNVFDAVQKGDAKEMWKFIKKQGANIFSCIPYGEKQKWSVLHSMIVYDRVKLFTKLMKDIGKVKCKLLFIQVEKYDEYSALKLAEEKNRKWYKEYYLQFKKEMKTESLNKSKRKSIRKENRKSIDKKEGGMFNSKSESVLEESESTNVFENIIKTSTITNYNYESLLLESPVINTTVNPDPWEIPQQQQSTTDSYSKQSSSSPLHPEPSVPDFDPTL